MRCVEQAYPAESKICWLTAPRGQCHRRIRGLERGRPERAIFQVLERHGHHPAAPIDRNVAEELQAEARREIVAQFVARCFLKNDRRTERAIERRRPPGSGVNGSGNKFPERLEVLEGGLVRIVVVRIAPAGVRPLRLAKLEQKSLWTEAYS